jgi:dihydrofolate reductase
MSSTSRIRSARTQLLFTGISPQRWALKEKPGGEIGVTGSISVVWKLIAAGLVDEYRLFVYPTMIGHGRRLYEDETSRPKLHLADTQTVPLGVVLLTYRAV